MPFLLGRNPGLLSEIDSDHSEYFNPLDSGITDAELELRIRSPKIRAVFAHWRAARQGRVFPRRSDVDPAAMLAALGHIIIVELSYDPFRVFYRLVGTEIVRWSKEDFTNRCADELVFQDDTRDWTDYYRKVVELRSVGFGVTYWRETRGRPYWIEHMICPLSSDGVTIDQCLAAEDYEPMSWQDFDALPSIGRRDRQPT